MCRVLGVSPGGYYAWLKRPLSARARADAELSARIAEIHRRSRAYGTRHSSQGINAGLVQAGGAGNCSNFSASVFNLSDASR